MLLKGCTVSHWEDDLTVILDEASVEVGESKEVLDVLTSFNGLDLLKGLHFYVSHFDSLA